MSKVIAIDFDGCLCENRFPSIGEPHWSVIHKVLDEQRAGAKLILWTCREGGYLDAAVKACEDWGIKFDAVNDSLDSWKERFGSNPRKVGATEYWDDKAVRIDGTFVYDGKSGVGSKPTKHRMTSLQESREAVRTIDDDIQIIKCTVNLCL